MANLIINALAIIGLLTLIGIVFVIVALLEARKKRKD